MSYQGLLIEEHIAELEQKMLGRSYLALIVFTVYISKLCMLMF